MINSLEASIGDCCYYLSRNDKKIKFGTIVRVIKKESAVEVIEALNSRFEVVWEKNAAWDEKELKGQKWEKPHNYIRENYVEKPDEKKPSKRISDVRDGKTKRVRRSGTKAKSKRVSKRTNRKS